MTPEPAHPAAQPLVASMMQGIHRAQAVYVVARLGIADLLANGPLTVDELAESAGARFPEPLLDRHRALNSIHGARKLCENAIASGIGDPAAMVPNQPVHDLASGSEGTQRPGLVLAHKARVASYVGGKDRRQPPFDPLFLLGRHRFTLPGVIVRRKGSGFKGRDRRP